MLVLSCESPVWAQGVDLALAVKAAYLCKLPEFVTWPAGTLPPNEFVICVVGQPALGKLLEQTAEGQLAQQRPIVVRGYARIPDNPGCQLVFAAGPGPEPVADILAVVRGAAVLTVTDGQIDPVSTGIVNFVLIDGRVRFAINRGAAAEHKLAISSKLLDLAVRVTD